MFHRLLVVSCIALAVPVIAAGSASAPPTPAAIEPPPAGGFRVAVEQPGVYAVRFEDLAEAGLGAAFLRSSALVATRGGEPVPIWVEDGGDGRFGPGDHLELIAEPPFGERTWHHPYSTEAAFLVGVSRRPSPRLAAGALEVTAAGAGRQPAGGAPALLARRHLEEDRLFLRFPQESVETSEVWFWARLTPLEREPLRIPVDLSDLDPSAAEPVRLRIGVRGWSRLIDPAAAGLADHRLEVGLAGRPLGAVEWDNREGGWVVEPPALEAGALTPGEHELTLEVPVRTLPGGDPIVDVVALDWIEIDYPRRPRVSGGPERFELAGGASPVQIAAPAQGLTLYTDAGERLSAALAPAAAPTGDDSSRDSAARARYSSPAGTDLGPGFWAVPAGGLLRPSSVRAIRGDGLRGRDRRADYLIVVHPRLRWQVEPLAAAHRRRGLEVEVVDVRAIYDQFGGGVEHPHAIRDFLAYTQESWRRPAPRFVLLVGDASWDTRSVAAERRRYADRPWLPGRGAVIGTDRTPTYRERSSHNFRGLLPTGSSATLEGHAASDARLAMLDGDRWPDLAIGRLPAATPAEAAAMVAKTLAYLERPAVGPWRRDVLWVSDGAPLLDAATDRLAQELAGRGFAAARVRPEASDADPAARRERLLAAIDRGPLVVHFIGHGGRNIWRTGQTSELAQTDLFTLDDLDRLSPADRLPVVLSMSCYSAPFDHPNADSIGEKLVRMDGRGAVAVVAASWRNVPTETMSRMLTDELTRPGTTIGEALLRAKRRNHSSEFIEQYNLLGDPALPLQVPGPLAVREAAALEGRRPAVIADLPFGGRALIEWRDRAGEVLERQELDASGPRLLAAFRGEPPAAARLGWAQVYLWNAEAGTDALGATEIHPPPPPARIAERAAETAEPNPAETPR